MSLLTITKEVKYKLNDLYDDLDSINSDLQNKLYDIHMSDDIECSISELREYTDKLIEELMEKVDTINNML